MLSSSGVDRVLLINQYALPEHKRNMNQYQRNYYGADYADVHLLIRRKCPVSQEISQRVKVHRAPVSNRVLFFFYAISLGLWLRFKGVDVVETDASIYALVGFVLKYVGRYFWVMDVWDPVRSDSRKGERRNQTLNGLVFRLMGCADLFVLSCLPVAAKQIQPHPDRSVQLFNAIDLSGVKANVPPHRSQENPILHLALARFRLGEKEGFHVVVQMAEKLQASDAQIRIHLVGHLDDEASELLANSSAKDLFQVHGFITQSRCDFFRSIHVGLVPYLPVWDMSYIFPIKVLEHLSQGNVVVASNVPGLATLIQHEHNGLLFEPGDSDDLARCILRLHNDLALWRRLSTNAIASVKKYDPRVKNQIIFEEVKKRRAQAFRERRRVFS